MWRAVDGVCLSFNSLTVYVREMELNRESTCMLDESRVFLLKLSPGAAQSHVHVCTECSL